MPKIDFKCPLCNHRFTRVVLRGEEGAASACPECGRSVKPEAQRPESLFDGIAGFSTLSKDTN